MDKQQSEIHVYTRRRNWQGLRQQPHNACQESASSATDHETSGILNHSLCLEPVSFKILIFLLLLKKKRGHVPFILFPILCHITNYPLLSDPLFLAQPTIHQPIAQILCHITNQILCVISQIMWKTDSPTKFCFSDPLCHITILCHSPTNNTSTNNILLIIHRVIKYSNKSVDGENVIMCKENRRNQVYNRPISSLSMSLQIILYIINYIVLYFNIAIT